MSSPRVRVVLDRVGHGWGDGGVHLVVVQRANLYARLTAVMWDLGISPLEPV